MTILLLALALVPSDRKYKKEVKAIVAADMREVEAMKLLPEMRDLATNLILMDCRLVLYELHKLPRNTTRANVDRALAQLSRDMEGIPALP